jgi:hypothetical protein
MLWGAAVTVAVLALLGWWFEDGGGASLADFDPSSVEPAAATLAAPAPPTAAPGSGTGARDSVAPTEGGAGAATADLSGLWRSASGEVYHLDHEGQEVLISAEMGGRIVGEGEGRFDGRLLVLAMSMPLPGGGIGQLACELQVAADRASMTGLCQGPMGITPAQIYR